MATESLRFHENVILTDNERIIASDVSDEIRAGRAAGIILFVDATIAQETAAVEFEEEAVGYAGQAAVFELTMGSADGGTFEIGIEDDMATALAYDISAANLQVALRAINSGADGWNEVTVSLATGTYTITFPLALEQPALVADFSGLTDGGVALETDATLTNTEEYAAAVDAVQSFYFEHISGGTFTITYGTDTSTDLAYNISAADLKTAIAGLNETFTTDNVAVTLASGVYTITFDSALGDVGEPEFGIASLTQAAVGVTPVPKVKQPGTENWFEIKDAEGNSYFAKITETGKASAYIPLTGDEFRVDYTVEGDSPLIDLMVSGTLKS